MSETIETARPRYWMGTVPAACDSCEKPITKTFIDGATKGGRWANLCLCCHRQIGVGVHPGVGQLYRIQDDGRWLKAEG
jgi:hypothetical protein